MALSVKKNTLCLVAGILMLAACQSERVSIQPSTSWQMTETAPAKENFYARGKAYLKSSDIGLAIDAFRQDLFLNGDSVRTFNGLGVAYDMLGRHDLSQKHYEQALALEPRSSITLSNLAYSQYLQGEYENAAKLARRAEECLPPQRGKKIGLQKVVSTNREMAEDGQSKKEVMLGKSATSRYEPQRTGENNWEIQPAKPQQPTQRPAKYKSSIFLQEILDQVESPQEDGFLDAALPAIPAYPVINMPRHWNFFSGGKQGPEISGLDGDEALAANKVLRAILNPVASSAENTGTETAAKAVTTTTAPVYRIVNGIGRNRMARRMASFLGHKGLRIGSLANADVFDGDSLSVIRFARGYEAEAKKLAVSLPAPVQLVEAENLRSKVEFVLGVDLILFDRGLFNGGENI